MLGFIDGVPGQVGTVLSGILLLLTAGLSGLEPVFWLGIGTAVIATLPTTSKVIGSHPVGG